MVLIIKKKNQEIFYVARLAKFGHTKVSLINLIDESDNLDERFIRIRLYKAVIDKLIAQGNWHRDRSYRDGDVTNTLHDWIVEWFNETKVSTLFVEVENDVFNKSAIRLEELMKQIM